MSKIRDNATVILGLTGYFGSGCTSLARLLAFQFTDKAKKEINDYNSSIISYLYSEILRLQKENRVENYDLIEKTRGKLKQELEKREIINAVKRNKFELKNNFYYLSFSDMIIYFVLKKLEKSFDKNAIDEEFKNLITDSLLEKGFELQEALDLIIYFDHLTRNIRFDLRGNQKLESIAFERDKVDKIIGLFSSFYFIKDKIIKKYGMQILQNYGDNIRKIGNPFIKGRKSDYKKARVLGGKVDKYISLLRSMGYRHFVVECFRNPQELYYFREKYSYFYLFALDTDLVERKKRVQIKEFNDISAREMGDDSKKESCEIYKLNVSRCMDLADIVIKNNGNLDEMFWKILRYFTLILEPGCIKPNHEETLMHLAYSLSIRSNCVSRQVGAVITNKEGYIIGAGWNDVGEGQISCGLKTSDDYKNIGYLKCDNLNFDSLHAESYVCFKDIPTPSENGKSDRCLALHAEENAILQLAKYHSGIPQDAVIYSTTFPCSSCLKKISQVGINKVIYIQTYSNPISIQILEVTTKTIKIFSFEGVKYYSYFKLFKPYYDRKEQQKILEYS